MLDLFEHLLANVYANWRQDGRIFKAAICGVVTLIRKNSSNKEITSNFRVITLLNTELKILVKVLTKRCGRRATLGKHKLAQSSTGRYTTISTSYATPKSR